MMLPLPIAPSVALAQLVDPALRLLPPRMTSASARVQMLTTALQESDLAARVQKGGGPARGLCQFERGGGVRGVLQYPGTVKLAIALCAVRGVPATSYSVYMSLAGDDILAFGFARLLLYTDPAPLPVPGDSAGAWACYLRTWRPGRPRPSDWKANYATALCAAAAAAA